MFEFVARILDFFYGLAPNFAVAIMLMTLLVMLITTPLTIKGTRGMIKMQLLAPELKKIQDKHKGGDREAMNAELMAFYQANELNPLGGCLPLLIQAPVFLILFNVINGLTARGPDGLFDPKYLSESSGLYQALHGSPEILSFGLDLSQSTSKALGESIVRGLPYLALILIMIGAQYYQQKQVTARNSGGPVNPTQQFMLKVMPVFFGVISINFAAALVIYWVTSSIYRIGLQYYITRSLYSGSESLGAKANAAAAEARALRDTERDGKRDGKRGQRAEEPPAKDDPVPPVANGRTTPAKPPHPSSKKKKRKKR